MSLRLFWEVARLSFQRQFTYRAAYFAGMVTNLFFGVLRVALLVALYGNRAEVAGISVVQAVTFSGLTQAAIGMLSMFGWYEVMNSVNAGDVSSDLLKPMNYFAFWLALDLGRAAAALVLRGIPIVVLYAVLFRIVIPGSVSQWLLVGVSVGLAWLVSFGWRFLVNLAAFWTPNALGVGRFAFGLSWILSGFAMPLRYFPDWFNQIANVTPFPATVNTPVEVFLGILTGPAMMPALLGQLAWAAALIVAGQLVLRAGVRELVIQGG